MARQIERQSTRLSSEIESAWTTSKNIMVLQVMLSGGPYVEDAETRRRSRYAVLSALGVAGYVPWDAEHIGYFEVPDQISVKPPKNYRQNVS